MAHARSQHETSRMKNGCSKSISKHVQCLTFGPASPKKRKKERKEQDSKGPLLCLKGRKKQLEHWDSGRSSRVFPFAPMFGRGGGGLCVVSSLLCGVNCHPSFHVSHPVFFAGPSLSPPPTKQNRLKSRQQQQQDKNIKKKTIQQAEPPPFKKKEPTRKRRGGLFTRLRASHRAIRIGRFPPGDLPAAMVQQTPREGHGRRVPRPRPNPRKPRPTNGWGQKTTEKTHQKAHTPKHTKKHTENTPKHTKNTHNTHTKTQTNTQKHTLPRTKTGWQRVAK